MDIGDIIREHRVKARLTQTELGDLIGASKNTILSWEAGRTFPNRLAAKKMAALFNIDEADLIYSKDAVSLKKMNNKSDGFLKANELVNQLVNLFASGDLSENDKEAVMLTLQSAYIACKVNSQNLPDVQD